MTDYQLVTNTVETDGVEERTIEGDRHLVVKDVPFIRSMRLSSGYVPEDEVVSSAGRWGGVPLTVNHPRNDAGQIVSANTPIGRESIVGRALNPRPQNGDTVVADLAVNAERARELGGAAQDILQKIEAGQPLEVSSQYFDQPLSAGVYDGENRARVVGNLQPDSIALVPNKTGVCSIEDGCGFVPGDQAAAASQARSTATANSLTAVDRLRIPVANAAHMADSDGDETANTSLDSLDVGDIVSWDSQGNRRSYGRVVETVAEGSLPASKITFSRDLSAPAVRIRLYRPTGDRGEWERADTEEGEPFYVGHKPETLTTEDDFPDMSPNAPESAVVPNPTAGGDIYESATAVSPNATDYEVTNVAPGDVDEFTDEDWDGDAATASLPNPSEDDDAATVLDGTHLIVPTDDEARGSKANWKLPFRTTPDAPANTRALVAAQAAIEGARGGVEDVADSALETAFDRATAFRQAAPADVFGSLGEDETPSANAGGLSDLFTRFASALGLDRDALSGNERAESRADSGTNAGCTTMDESERKQKITTITENSPITANSLEDACDDRINQIHEDVTANTDDDPDDDPGDDPGATANSDGLTADQVREIVREEVNEATANAETQQLAQRIVANSAEYDDEEAVREDYPTEAALRAKADQLESSPGLPGGSATTGGVGVPTPNSDEGPDVNVSSGVLTE